MGDGSGFPEQVTEPGANQREEGEAGREERRGRRQQIPSHEEGHGGDVFQEMQITEQEIWDWMHQKMTVAL
jgi:hypothetical protein